MNKNIIEILILSLLWGSALLFNKVALMDTHPITLVTARLSLASLLFYFVLKFKDIKFPTSYLIWKHGIVLGVLLNGLPFMCFNFALLRISSHLVALVVAITPILTLIFSRVFIKNLNINWRIIVGIIISFCGLTILLVPSILDSQNAFNVQGILLSFLGAICYAGGAVYGQKNIKNISPLAITMVQLLTATLYLIPLAFIFESPIELMNASLLSLSCILSLAILGTVFAYLVYYRILIQQGAVALSMVTYLIPTIGTFLGIIVLKESVDINFFMAAILIFSGLLIGNRRK